MENKRKKKKFTISTKNMGVDIDKNEYYEIICSNSAHPEDFYKKKTNRNGLS
jgi:predicted nucleic-acid-binding Zn-ribbon protein